MSDPRSGEEPGEDMDVGRVHGQIWREYDEPTELYNAIPGWLKHGIYAPLLIWGVWYLIVYTGGFQPDRYYEGFGELKVPEQTEPAQSDGGGAGDSAPSEEELAMAAGEKVYARVCLSCHQANGAGVPGAFPPLAGSAWVEKRPDALAALVLHGLQGPIEVKGMTYDAVMPPWRDSLDDEQIAHVLTYVRRSWGNTAPPVDEATVSAVRESIPSRAPWTAAELEAEFPPEEN